MVIGGIVAIILITIVILLACSHIRMLDNDDYLIHNTAVSTNPLGRSGDGKFHIIPIKVDYLNRIHGNQNYIQFRYFFHRKKLAERVKEYTYILKIINLNLRNIEILKTYKINFVSIESYIIHILKLFSPKGGIEFCFQVTQVF